MVIVKSIFAGVATVLGFILLLLLLPTLIHHIVVPILRFMRYHGGNRAILFYIPHVGWIAGIVFLVGFGLELAREKQWVAQTCFARSAAISAWSSHKPRT